MDDEPGRLHAALDNLRRRVREGGARSQLRFTDAAVQRFADRIRALPETASQVEQAQSNGWAKRPSLLAQTLFSEPDAAEQFVHALDELYADSTI